MIIPGVILAGGRSSRMGAVDKSTCQLGGTRLLDHALARLQPQVSVVAVNSDEPDLSLPGAVQRLPDVISGRPGPLAGIATAMQWARELGASLVVTVPVDSPFAPGDLVPQLLLASEHSESGLALAAGLGGDGVTNLQPTFGLWPVALLDDLLLALEQDLRKVRQWADRHAPAIAVFPTDRGDPFFNINTPDDLRRAEAWVARTA